MNKKGFKRNWSISHEWPQVLLYLPTWAVCLQLWPHCFNALWASSSSCFSLPLSAQGPEGSRAGGVPGEPWSGGKCSQIFVLIPFKPRKPNNNTINISWSLLTPLHILNLICPPKELWDGPRKGLSDWGWDRWVEKKGEAWGLTGGDGEGELKGAELLKEPGMLTGAELCSWLPPVEPKSEELTNCLSITAAHCFLLCLLFWVKIPSMTPTLDIAELLSKLFSSADTPKSFRSRSSRADSVTQQQHVST